jgi:hypothetical protein
MNFIPENQMTPPSGSGTGLHFIPEDEMTQMQSEQPSSTGFGSMLQSGLNILAPQLGNLAAAVAQNPRILLSGAEGVLGAIPRAVTQTAAGLSGVAAPFSPLSQILPQESQAVPTTSPQVSNLLSTAAMVVPSAESLENLPVGSALKDLSKLGGAGLKGSLDALQNKLGLSASKKATSFVNDLLGDQSMSSATKPVAEELKGNYQAAKQTANSQYTDILNQASQSGYPDEIEKQFPGISTITPQKAINPEGFQNFLSNIDLGEHSKTINDSISDFLDSPSFANAHDLQSELGKTGAKLATNPDGSIRQLGGQLLQGRSLLNNDITNSLANNGDTDLANQYAAAGQNYKNTVAPFLENPTLRKMVLKKGLQINPSNIANLLKSNDQAVDLVRQNLSDPSKNLLLATKLKGAVQDLPGAQGFQRNVDPTALVNAYGNLDNQGLGYLRTPESAAQIADIMNNLSRQRVAKWAAGVGGPIAGVSLLGAPIYHHLF